MDSAILFQLGRLRPACHALSERCLRMPRSRIIKRSASAKATELPGGTLSAAPSGTVSTTAPPSAATIGRPRLNASVRAPSRPREFHPETLTDPDLSLSTHPARATEEGSDRLHYHYRFFLFPVDLSNFDDPAPSLLLHYRAFITTTGQSAPSWRLDTFGLGLSPLRLFS